jgi:hypothetical protein
MDNFCSASDLLCVYKYGYLGLSEELALLNYGYWYDPLNVHLILEGGREGADFISL